MGSNKNERKKYRNNRHRIVTIVLSPKGKVTTQNAIVQRAVWRKRGSGSPESLCEFGSFSPVRTAVEAPLAPSRWERYTQKNPCQSANKFFNIEK